MVLEHVEAAERPSHEVYQAYERTPQETQRLADLDNLWDEAEAWFRRLHQALKPKPGRTPRRKELLRCLLGLARIVRGRSGAALGPLGMWEDQPLDGTMTDASKREFDALMKKVWNILTH